MVTKGSKFTKSMKKAPSSSVKAPSSPMKTAPSAMKKKGSKKKLDPLKVIAGQVKEAKRLKALQKSSKKLNAQMIEDKKKVEEVSSSDEEEDLKPSTSAPAKQEAKKTVPSADVTSAAKTMLMGRLEEFSL